MGLLGSLVVPVAAADERLGVGVVASQTCVMCARARSSLAPGPPILVGTQPGSTACATTSGLSRATAAMSVVTNNFASEYECVSRFPVQSTPARSGRPPPCMLLLR